LHCGARKSQLDVPSVSAVARLASGATAQRDAQQPGSSPMPWAEYARMSDRELAAIYRFLQSFPQAGS
jgi:hypothetical protein